MLIRFILYGLGGWCGEVLFTATRDRLRGRVRDWKLKGTTYLWMFPLYGSIVFLYEPLHDAIRSWPWVARGVLYTIGFFAVWARLKPRKTHSKRAQGYIKSRTGHIHAK